MATQENGITVVRVENELRTIVMYVGDVEVALWYSLATRHFMVMKRTSLTSRNPRPFIPMLQYRAMMQQAHAIASRHGWK